MKKLLLCLGLATLTASLYAGEGGCCSANKTTKTDAAKSCGADKAACDTKASGKTAKTEAQKKWLMSPKAVSEARS